MARATSAASPGPGSGTRTCPRPSSVMSKIFGLTSEQRPWPWQRLASMDSGTCGPLSYHVRLHAFLHEHVDEATSSRAALSAWGQRTAGARLMCAWSARVMRVAGWLSESGYRWPGILQPAHRLRLAHVPSGIRPQVRPERGRRPDPAEQIRHRAIPGPRQGCLPGGRGGLLPARRVVASSVHSHLTP
jgi:hypothetical protein